MSKSCALPKSTFPLKFKVKSPSHALQLARKLIAPYRNWITDALASLRVEGESDERDEVDVKDPRAEAFCALGALRRVNTKHARRAEKFLGQAALLLGGTDYPEDLATAGEEDITQFNDYERSKEHHRKVLKMFTKAVHLARKWEKSR